MKKMVLRSALFAVAGIGLMAGISSADTFDGVALQAQIDAITKNPINNSSVNAFTDMLGDASDSYWQIGGTGHSVSTVVIELGSYAPDLRFGVFDATNPNTWVQVFDGTAITGTSSALSILADGSVLLNLFNDTGIDFAGNAFGYYLDSPIYTSGALSGYNRFFSDTALNADKFDHMFAYEGTGDIIQILPYSAGPWLKNEYLFAWEDILGGGDQDYDDFIVMVESVQPIPEPATMLLFGTGLAGLAGAARRRKK